MSEGARVRRRRRTTTTTGEDESEVDLIPILAPRANRNLVDVILFNDSTNYLMLGIKCFAWPTDLGILEVAQYLFGFFLGVFNYWAKIDAHR